MADTLLVNSTDLAGLVVMEDLSDIFAAPPSAQEPIAIPGRAGELFVAGVAAAYDMVVPVTIERDTHAEMRAAMATLTALLDSKTAPLTLTRRSDTLVGGVPGVLDESCAGLSRDAWEVTGLGGLGVRIVLTLRNLDGTWTA